MKKGFKGFNKDFTCRDTQYKIGDAYEIEKDKKLACCPENSNEAGLHFCENPMDVFNYYAPAESKFAEVEAEGEIKQGGDDSKVSARKLHIRAELTLNGLLKAGVKFILDRVKWDEAPATNTGNRSAATNTGNRSAATNTGDRSAATNTGDQSAATNTGDQSAATNTGDQSAATNTGDQSAATNTGNRSAATNTGNYSAATNTGDRSAATNTGNYSAATNTGDYSAATNTGNQSAATNTGDQSAATNTGDQSAATNTGNYSAATVEGAESVAISLGIEGKAKANKGSWIVLAEWKRDENINWHRTAVKSFQVDGDVVKADTFYMLVGGELKEVK